jgi:hypothetical protein
MNSLVLITAMAATSGLFGKHCGQPKHHAKKAVASCYSSAPCGMTYAVPYASPQGMAAPSAQSGMFAPTKMATPAASTVPPAPPVPAAAPMPSPSSAIAPNSQPNVATGDLR